MLDNELVNLLHINCNTIGTKKEEKSMKYNQNKGKVINAGSEQCCTNTGLEKDCDKKDNYGDSCTNTGNSLNLNNRPCNASLPTVKDNATDYLLSGTKETNDEIEFRYISHSVVYYVDS